MKSLGMIKRIRYTYHIMIRRAARLNYIHDIGLRDENSKFVQVNQQLHEHQSSKRRRRAILNLEKSIRRTKHKLL